ncbi:MAG: hypothetical protein ACO1RX_12365 [Candidatus Sericytochromatia bacterium]
MPFPQTLSCSRCSLTQIDGVRRCAEPACALHLRRLPVRPPDTPVWTGRVFCLIGLILGGVGLRFLFAFASAHTAVFLLSFALSAVFIAVGTVLAGMGLLQEVGQQTELKTGSTALLVLEIWGLRVGGHHFRAPTLIALQAPAWPGPEAISQVVVQASPILLLGKLLRAEKTPPGPSGDEALGNNADAVLYAALVSLWAQGHLRLMKAQEERYLGPWRWFTTPNEYYWSPGAMPFPATGSEQATLEEQIWQRVTRWQQVGRAGSGPLGLTLDDICAELFHGGSDSSPDFTLAQQVRRHNPWMEKADQRWVTRPERQAERLRLQQRYADWLAAWTARQPELAHHLERAVQKALLARKSSD